jgi:hypothetical protein
MTKPDCPDDLFPGGEICPRCGGPRGPSGCNGGEWVHLDTAPDRVVCTSYSLGKWTKTVLANGVVIRPKHV